MNARKEFNVFKSAFFNSAIDKALDDSCDKKDCSEPCYTAALTNKLSKILND